MATIGELFGIGLSGLNANKALAAIASQNIANANTPGYTRETLLLTTRFMGLPGVDVSGPRAIRNPFLGRQLVDAFSRLGYHTGQQTALDRIDAAINDLDGTGLATELTEFQSALQALSANPGGDAERDGLLSAAEQLMATFSSTRRQLMDGAQATYGQAVDVAGEANGYLDEIASLNAQIRSLANSGQNVEALVDKRDNLVGELSKLVDVQTVPQEDGSVSIFAGGGRSLVEGDVASEIVVGAQGPPPDYAVEVTIRRENGTDVELMAPIGGQLGGLLDAHQDTITDAVARLDQLAFDFATAFNAQHEAGFALDGTNGHSFFVVPTQVEGAAANLRLSADVADDPSNIAAASDAANVPGGNGNLAALEAVLTDAGVVTGGESVIGAWRSVVGDITAAQNLAQTGVDLEAATTSQLSNLLLSETGVDVDEELVLLTQANSAFEAASQIIQVAEEMTSTVLNMVG